jgi:3-phosphoshikimate 1-carboxyvinyltransferase
MNRYTITRPQKLRATVKLPASKSISNRALVICALSAEQHCSGAFSFSDVLLPRNLSDCDDTEVIIDALRLMPPFIDIKAAGTAMRFMTAFLAATASGTHVITGTERMKHRPISLLVEALRSLGAQIEYEGQEGFPPLRIGGRKLDGGELEIAGNISSQFISALLMIGPVLKRGLTLHLTGDIISRPYIDLTLWTMREFGADAEWTSVDTIEVKPTEYRQREYLVENDWSAASYWYEMVALSPDPNVEVTLEGLMDGSKQGDSSVRYIFSLLGVKTVFEQKKPGVPTRVVLKKNGHRVPLLKYDFLNVPDLAQTFVVTCCAMGVPFHFTGLQTLKIKETDRISALKTELAKLGYDIADLNGSELLWDGKVKNVGGGLPAIDTYDDHRMALSFAPLALCRRLAINSPQVVTKSYPQFWNHLQQAGFTVEEG